MNAFRPPLDYSPPYNTVPANDIFEPEYDPSPFDDDSECTEEMAGWGGLAGLALTVLIVLAVALYASVGGGR